MTITDLQLADCTATLLAQIATGKHPEVVSQTWALALHSDEPIDWTRVRAAAENRWGWGRAVDLETRAHEMRSMGLDLGEGSQ